MEIRRASVVCTSHPQASVRTVTTIAITVSAIDAATSLRSGGDAF
jgi:hypothetical protein